MCHRDNKCLPVIGGGWTDPDGPAKQGRMLNWLCCNPVFSHLYNDLWSSEMTFYVCHQIWKAAKSALLIPRDFNIHHAAFAFVEKSLTVLEKSRSLEP